MTLDTLTQELKSISTIDIKNGWTEKHAKSDVTFGLNISSVQKVAKNLKKDAILADEIYSGDNHDLKVLATFIDDPESYTRDEISDRIKQVYPSPFSDKFCENVLAKSPLAVHFIDSWKDSDEERLRNYAYTTLASVAKQKNSLGVEFFVNHLNSISGSIKDEPRHVRKAMYKSMINIGCRDNFLKEACMAAARRVGLIRLNGNSSVDLLLKIQKVSETRKQVFA
ncbi:MAG: DNA alkylation repair protein [Bacteroidota bacterium]